MASTTEKEKRVHDLLNAKKQSDDKEARTFVEHWLWVGKMLFRMLKDPTYRFPGMVKVLAVVAFLYLLSPVDIVPELFLGPLGLIDDVGLIAMVGKMLHTEIVRYGDEKADS